MSHSKLGARAHCAFLLLAFFLLAGCASRAVTPDKSVPWFKPLPEAARGHIGTPDILIGVGQTGLLLGDQGKLWAPPPVSVATSAEKSKGVPVRSQGGGPSLSGFSGTAAIVILLVVGTVVLTVIATQQGYETYDYYMAERAVLPVRRSLQGFDFGEHLRQSFDEHGRPVLHLKDGQVSLVEPATPLNLEAQHRSASSDSVLIVGLNYMLSPDLNTFEIVAEANLFPKTEALQTLQREERRRSYASVKQAGALDTHVTNSLYRRVVSYRSNLPTRFTDKDTAAKAWADNGGERIRAVLAEGSTAISRLIVRDLSETTTTLPFEDSLEIEGKTLRVALDSKGVWHVGKFGVISRATPSDAPSNMTTIKP